jgi:catechol 2,3-dioxygenase-like lactoylglutathione lyase family enzyme
MEQPRFNHIGPQFAVRDVARAISFYGEALGLTVDYVDGDPPEYAVVYRDEVYIHLSVSADPDFNPGGGRAFLAVSGVNGVWEQVCSGFRTSVIQTLADWDFRHGVRFRGFIMKDLDGNVLRIGEPSKGME